MGNQYDASGFPAILDALVIGDRKRIDQEISIATYFVRGAAAALKQFNNFMFH